MTPNYNPALTVPAQNNANKLQDIYGTFFIVIESSKETNTYKKGFMGLFVLSIRLSPNS